MRKTSLRNKLLITIASSLIFAELFSRLFNVAPGDRLFIPNPDFGWFHVPGAEAVRNGQTIRINANGLRDYEHAYTKSDGTYRILVLGDSFTEAMQVPLEAAFSEQLESILSRQFAGQRVEVINAGVSGYGTGNELLFYIHEGRKYEPDLVILLFYLNDLSDNVERPFYTFDGEDLVSNPDAFDVTMTVFPELGSLWWDYSYAYRNISTGLRVAIGFSRMNDAEPQVNPPYVDPLPPEVETQWKLADALITNLSHEVEADGVPLLIADIPSLDSLLQEEIGPGFNYRQVTDRLEDILEPTGACFFPLRDVFRPLVIEGRQLYIPLDGHWNEAGHALAAETVADQMADCKELSLSAMD